MSMLLTATALEIPFSNAPVAPAIAPDASLQFPAAIHRSRGLFRFGACRVGGAILRPCEPWAPCGCAWTDSEPMIKIAVVAIAPTMFEYRRPTSWCRQWPTIRPDRQPHHNPADRSSRSHPADHRPGSGWQVDGRPGLSLSLRSPRPPLEQASTD